MKTPHKHAELIKAWADGATIETFYGADDSWDVINGPCWMEDSLYRVKPEPILSQAAQDMVSSLIVNCARANHAIYNELADTVRKESARDTTADQLKHYILTLEQAVLNPKTP